MLDRLDRILMILCFLPCLFKGACLFDPSSIDRGPHRGGREACGEVVGEGQGGEGRDRRQVCEGEVGGGGGGLVKVEEQGRGGRGGEETTCEDKEREGAEGGGLSAVVWWRERDRKMWAVTFHMYVAPK